MASYNKFDKFVEDLLNKALDIFGSPIGDSLKVLLTNTSPNAADTHVDTVLTPCVIEATSNAVEIAAGNGYTKGGETPANQNCTRSGGTATLVADQVVWTCVTAAMPTFRYVALYDNTGGAADTRPVVAWWDYGVGGVTLNPGETFTVKFNNQASGGTIFTLA